MDDHERTVRRIRTEEVIDDSLTEPVVVAADPIPPAPAAVAHEVSGAYPEGVVPPVVRARDRVVTERAVISDRPSTLDVLRRVVTLAFGILQGLLILRVVLLLLVANRDNEIVGAILATTEPFVAPFADMFALDRVGSGSGSVLDIAALVALVGWTLVELLILAVLNLGARRSRVETF